MVGFNFGFSRPERIDIRPFLERKFAIQEQEANARTTSAGAQATGAQAGLISANATRDLVPSQIGLTEAQTGLTGAEAREVGPNARVNRLRTESEAVRNASDTAVNLNAERSRNRELTDLERQLFGGILGSRGFGSLLSR